MNRRPPMWLRVLLAVGIISACLPTFAIDAASAKPTTGPTVTASVSPAPVPVRRPTVPGSVIVNPTGAGIPVACISHKYPDGVWMFTMCVEYGDTPGAGWWSGWRGLTNIGTGGHSDIMRYCIYGFHWCSTYVSDGNSMSDGASYSINDSDTMWVEVDVKYGTTWYCRRVFTNKFGAQAVTTCP